MPCERVFKIEAFYHVLPGELVKQCQFVLMTNINKLSQREHFKQYCLGNTMLFSNNARCIQMSSLEAYSV